MRRKRHGHEDRTEGVIECRMRVQRGSGGGGPETGVLRSAATRRSGRVSRRQAGVGRMRKNRRGPSLESRWATTGDSSQDPVGRGTCPQCALVAWSWVTQGTRAPPGGCGVPPTQPLRLPGTTGSAQEDGRKAACRGQRPLEPISEEPGNAKYKWGQGDPAPKLSTPHWRRETGSQVPP